MDLAFVLHALCVEVKARIDAAEHLPHTAKRGWLVDQVDGMIDGCNQEDKRTGVILENVSACMEQLGEMISTQEASMRGGSGVVCICPSLVRKGKD